MAGFHIITGFKATIRSILMDTKEQLATLDLIKAEALKIERRLVEKQRTSTNDVGTSRVLHTNQINQISNDTQQEDKVKAIGQKNFDSGRLENPRGNGLRCSFCNKPGHKVKDCGKKHEKPHSNATTNTQGDSNATKKKKCAYKCYKLQRNITKTLKEQKTNINQQS